MVSYVLPIHRIVNRVALANKDLDHVSAWVLELLFLENSCKDSVNVLKKPPSSYAHKKLKYR
jgi:hypothetical protein